ncbi:hypothetical protein BDR26DRAFT_872796 [Obelidium mucronatum]|nr:hypothetical protein BDR26DRAFT_872796 [Obelidium mucronatum]
MPHPQIAPLQTHLSASDDHPANNAKMTKQEKARLALLYATYPVLNPINSDRLHAVQRINPMYPQAYAKSPKKRALARAEKEYDEGDFVRTTRLAPAVLPLHVEIHNGCRDKYTRIITKDDGVLNGDGIKSKNSGDTAHCVSHNVPEWPEEYADIAVYEADVGNDSSKNVCVPITTQLHTISKFSSYTNEHTNELAVSDPLTYVVEWYVSFTDQGILQFNDSDNFASEEIKALENPLLGSLRDCMYDLSRNGVLYQKKNFSNNPLIHDDIHFHLPKHKQKDEFRDSEIDPLSRDYAGLCTPVLIQGVPKLATIQPGSLYGKLLNDPDVTLEALKKATMAHSKTSRHKNNFIFMSAPDRLSNPLRPKLGPYTIYQIRQIFRTAYTAFRGAVLKAKETFECLKEVEGFVPADRFQKPSFKTLAKSLTQTLTFGGSSNSRVADSSDNVKAPLLKTMKGMQVVIHTGDWGTGEFKNHPTVMAYLQISRGICNGLLREVWKVESGEKVTLDLVLRHLEKQEFCWGEK